jgi:uncharacterized protein (DUF433 family)
MKVKHILPIFALTISLFLISWGYTGHRLIGTITENHLNPKAKSAIKELLGDTTIADACTWADDARKDPRFKETANWHFLNLPMGLTFEQFKKYIDTASNANVYTALKAAEKTLRDKNAVRQEKVYALKFLMHFVSDLHQPMHISRAEDKGGNTIQLNYDGKGTNLHSLWDTKMLERQGLTVAQLAEKYDQIPADQVKAWQKDSIITWIWESYQLTNQLYPEIDALSKKVIDDNYDQKYLPVVQKRIQQAAVRLAGLLNNIYAK